MTEPLPKWLMRHYSNLWNKFKDKEFKHATASKVLKNEKMTSIILSELRKANWANVRLDPQDSRKRFYKLKGPEEVIKEISK